MGVELTESGFWTFEQIVVSDLIYTAALAYATVPRTVSSSVLPLSVLTRGIFMLDLQIPLDMFYPFWLFCFFHMVQSPIWLDTMVMVDSKQQANLLEPVWFHHAVGGCVCVCGKRAISMSNSCTVHYTLAQSSSFLSGLFFLLFPLPKYSPYKKWNCDWEDAWQGRKEKKRKKKRRTHRTRPCIFIIHQPRTDYLSGDTVGKVTNISWSVPAATRAQPEFETGDEYLVSYHFGSKHQ